MELGNDGVELDLDIEILENKVLDEEGTTEVVYKIKDEKEMDKKFTLDDILKKLEELKKESEGKKQRFEHKFINCAYFYSNIREELAKYEKDGWELCGTFHTSSDYGECNLFFKRPVD